MLLSNIVHANTIYLSMYQTDNSDMILQNLLRFGMPLFYISGPQCINNCQCQNVFAGDISYINGFRTTTVMEHSFISRVSRIFCYCCFQCKLYRITNNAFRAIINNYLPPSDTNNLDVRTRLIITLMMFWVNSHLHGTYLVVFYKYNMKF